MLKIAVMGAGAVGGYYGALLARAGHDVTLVAREPNVQAVRRHGLHLEMAGFDGQVPLHATTQPEGVAGADVVLCCVKSTDTEAAARAMAPHLSPGTRVLSLQNGVDNAQRLRAVLPASARVASAVVYVAVAMAGPGHVRHHGRGELVLPPGALDDAQVRGFVEAGIPVVWSDHLDGALWAKLIVNCAYNALSAIVQRPYGVLWDRPDVQAVMRDVVAECLAVAQADGVTVPGDAWTAVESIARSMPGQCSSTAQDLARGRASEIDHLNGFIVRRGAAHGIPTPANQVLHTLVKLLEQALPGAPSTHPRTLP